MREIEFRGKVADEPDEWVYGWLVDKDRISQDKETKNTKCCGVGTFIVKEETVGQYTGLKDKNRKKIFEGDIVKINDETTAKVIWDNDYLGYFLYTNEENSIDTFENGEQPLYDYLGSIEVIGNIYDNSELLEVEDE